MLCQPPRFEDAVFPAFRRERHIRQILKLPSLCRRRALLSMGDGWLWNRLFAGLTLVTHRICLFVDCDAAARQNPFCRG